MKLSLKSIIESHVIDKGLSEPEVLTAIKSLGFELKDSVPFDISDIVKGANVEIEHKNVVNFSPSKLVQIALDHLNEDPDYYRKLEKVES